MPLQPSVWFGLSFLKPTRIVLAGDGITLSISAQLLPGWVLPFQYSLCWHHCALLLLCFCQSSAAILHLFQPSASLGGTSLSSFFCSTSPSALQRLLSIPPSWVMLQLCFFLLFFFLGFLPLWFPPKRNLLRCISLAHRIFLPFILSLPLSLSAFTPTSANRAASLSR